MGPEAGGNAVTMMLGSPTGQLCLSCLINAMQYLPNDESAKGSIQTCGEGNGVKYFVGGQNGQLILSKYKITNVHQYPFLFLIFR